MSHESNLIDGLTFAGWSSIVTTASAVVTFLGQPADGDTITLDSGPAAKTYRFKTVMTSPYDIQIDSNANFTARNLTAAVIGFFGSVTPNAFYFNPGTLMHTTMFATNSRNLVTITYLTTGSAGNGAPISTTSANLSFSSATLLGGKTTLSTGQTGQLVSLDVHYVTGLGYNPSSALVAMPIIGAPNSDIPYIYAQNNLNQPLIMVRGDDFFFTGAVTQGGTPLDLTGATLYMTAKWVPTDPIEAAVFQLTSIGGDGIFITSAQGGLLSFHVSAGMTSSLPLHRLQLYFDVQMITSSGLVKTIMNDLLTVIPEITTPL